MGIFQAVNWDFFSEEDLPAPLSVHLLLKLGNISCLREEEGRSQPFSWVLLISLKQNFSVYSCHIFSVSSWTCHSQFSSVAESFPAYFHVQEPPGVLIVGVLSTHLGSAVGRPVP